MKHLDNFGDSRQMLQCVYCGGTISTLDHVPSKAFLDEPFPENLPKVPACLKCNYGFSKDEEYLACLIECAKTGIVNPPDIKREKTRKSLEHSKGLARLIKNSLNSDKDGAIAFSFDSERVRKVLLKLVKGHAAFEFNEPQYTEPAILNFSPLHCLPESAQMSFNTPPLATGYPEVGSRGMQRALSCPDGWVDVQPGRYRYLAVLNGGQSIIRLVISEYLGCEAVWE